MTAVDVVAALRRRGFQVRVCDGKLAITPGSRLSDTDRAALAAHKVAILALLGAEAATPPRADRCGLCGASDWTWAPDWPEPGAGLWLCRTCGKRSAPMLADVAATLTDDERKRFAVEVESGDPLASHVIAALDREGA